MIAYLQLTKPRIMTLVLLTGAAALFMEGSLVGDPIRLGLVLLALYLIGGSANALNQYLERDIDAVMERTRTTRPLPRGVLSPRAALVFSIAIGVAGTAILAVFFNLLAAALALGTILFYGFFYTLVLKPNTHLNIVFGGAAGAMAPPIAWAAAVGQVAPAAWVLAAIIFIWTPPHFWALALFRKSDYEAAGLPMMPLVKGDAATLDQILIYSVALVGVSLALLLYGAGWIYGVTAAILGAIFVARAVVARRTVSERTQRRLFGYSIVYLLALFGAVIADGFL